MSLESDLICPAPAFARLRNGEIITGAPLYNGAVQMQTQIPRGQRQPVDLRVLIERPGIDISRLDGELLQVQLPGLLEVGGQREMGIVSVFSEPIEKLRVVPADDGEEPKLWKPDGLLVDVISYWGLKYFVELVSSHAELKQKSNDLRALDW